MQNWSPFTSFAMGLFVGVGIVVATVPISTDKNKCETYFVSKKVATSYVLKPPFQPAVEKVVFKDPEPRAVDKETEKVEPKEEAPKKRHYRRHRRHWRR